MRISKFLLVLLISGGAALSSYAQSDPEQQKKALDLLHQALAKEQAHPAKAQTKPAPAPAPAPIVAKPMVSPAPQPAPATYSGSAISATQQQALELLRKTIASESAAPTKSTHTAAQAKPISKPGKPAPKTTVAAAPAPVSSGSPEVHTGPKTKQDRLEEIGELYKADKMTPTEYHAQRAKILAEP
jgi:hypothetical protein